MSHVDKLAREIAADFSLSVRDHNCGFVGQNHRHLLFWLDHAHANAQSRCWQIRDAEYAGIVGQGENLGALIRMLVALYPNHASHDSAPNWRMVAV